MPRFASHILDKNIEGYSENVLSSSYQSNDQQLYDDSAKYSLIQDLAAHYLFVRSSSPDHANV
jgi:hypothetical protein